MAKEFAKAFYKSKAWKACRRSYIDKRIGIDGGLCEECHEEPGEELHHIEEITIFNINNPDVTLNEKNLEWLCKNCHFKKHKKKIMEAFERAKGKKVLSPSGIWFDENGDPQTQKVYIVYGAPASGKTTYVMKNKQHGDLVVDLDLIKQMLTMCNKTEAPDNVLNIAFAVRDLIYNMIKQKEVDCKNIWIVASLPAKKKRETLKEELGAELIFIKAEYEDCISRAMNDGERTNKLFQEYIIEKWFESYEE